MSSMFPTFEIAGSALTTHQIWMNAIADNIANVNTVKPMSESAYQEKFIVAQEIPSTPGQPVGVGGGVAPVAVQPAAVPMQVRAPWCVHSADIA